MLVGALLALVPVAIAWFLGKMNKGSLNFEQVQDLAPSDFDAPLRILRVASPPRLPEGFVAQLDALPDLDQGELSSGSSSWEMDSPCGRHIRRIRTKTSREFVSRTLRARSLLREAWEQRGFNDQVDA